MSLKGSKTITYSLDWDTIVNLESRLIESFKQLGTTNEEKAY
jgi:hypothetical protein